MAPSRRTQPKKKATISSTTQTPDPTHVTRQKTSKKPPPKAKKIKLKTPTEAKDTTIGQQVAFPLFGERHEWLQDPKLIEFGRLINGSKYLCGTVAKREGGKTGVSYVIEWEATALNKTKISEPGIVFKALNLASL